jgi:Mrp family chromosome partitioning ATPase
MYFSIPVPFFACPFLTLPLQLFRNCILAHLRKKGKTHMQTIVLASQKGGEGKSTLVAHLAVEAEYAGAGPIIVIDTDP